MNTPHLPTPRTLLTSMINTNPVVDDAGANTKATSPILPLSARPILTTLHVLYPGILLPALDLLDRSLLTRVTLSRDSELNNIAVTSLQDNATHERIDGSPLAVLPPTVSESDALRLQAESSSSSFYIVRSSQDTRSKKRPDYTPTTSQSYIVRTSAWNCSCAAFAYNAFPPTIPASQWKSQRIVTKVIQSQLRVLEPDSSASENDDSVWSFGGVSRSGRNGEGVPCCKHLLACVLAERWKNIFGKYVVDTSVSREEMAGLGAGE